MRQDCRGTLVDQTEKGDMRSAAMVMDLMEKKKKKDGEDEAEPDGPSLAEQLAGPSWDELQEAKRIAREKRRPKRREKSSYRLATGKTASESRL